MNDERRTNTKKVKESARHDRQKVRLANIFRIHGFKAENERRFPCLVPDSEITCRYRVDVFAQKGTRKIIAEVDGYMGHKTQYAIAQQGLRTRRIREKYGRDIEVYRYTFQRLTKWTDQEIAKEMRL